MPNFEWRMIWLRFFRAKPKRVALRFVPYREAEALILAGWTIAKEEDQNWVFGWVYLELLESASAASAASCKRKAVRS